MQFEMLSLLSAIIMEKLILAWEMCYHANVIQIFAISKIVLFSLERGVLYDNYFDGNHWRTEEISNGPTKNAKYKDPSWAYIKCHNKGSEIIPSHETHRRSSQAPALTFDHCWRVWGTFNAFPQTKSEKMWLSKVNLFFLQRDDQSL